MGQDTNQTLFHELLHSVCKEYGMANADTANLLYKLGNDEMAVDILAKEICGALRQLGVIK
jgi:Zn-dependent peptidase ImmA (M78 family)